ncbi:MAG: putative glycoside hydrolase [Oscillospiraceae bacterium]
MKKKKNIKIKHRKYSLYQRKKSKGRKALTVVLMIVLIAGLCVLGYGLGRPLVEYFSGKSNTSEPTSAWTPPVTTPATGETTAEATPDAPATAEATTDAVQNAGTASAYILPESAVLSSESLNSALAAAKNTGCTDITVTLKDETGYFLYKTAVAGIPESQITGTLTAKQIADIITKAGFNPRARINTLLDRTSQTYGGENICYMIADGGIWHDYYVDRGGKSWLDPFAAGTSKYLAAITAEISQAGFGSVILANTIYPAFNTQDYSNFLRQLPIGDDSARLEALWNVISACNAAAKPNGAELLLEMSDADLFADSKALTSAEAASDKTKLKAVSLLVDFNPEEKTGYVETKAFIGRISAMYSGTNWAVRLTTSGFSGTALAEVRRAFSDSGITVFSE